MENQCSLGFFSLWTNQVVEFTKERICGIKDELVSEGVVEYEGFIDRKIMI